MKEEMSPVFLTCDSVLPTRAVGIVTRSLERQYVGDQLKETIGLRGVPALLTYPAELHRH